jgi:hypothetical protein
MSAPKTPGQDIVTLLEFEDRLVSLCLQSGVRSLPRKKRDQHIILKSVTLTFDKTKEYTETSVNQRLRTWLDDVGRSLDLDHVRLRCHLVDAEFLGRNKDGSRYWVAAFSRNQIPFDSEVENIDVYALIQQRREANARLSAGPGRRLYRGPKTDR